MQAIRDAATPLAPNTRTTVATSSRRGRGRGRARRREAAPRPTSKARSRTTASAARPRRSTTGRSPRGANAPLVEEVLRAVAPNGLSQTELRNAMQEKGVSISFTSIRNALRQDTRMVIIAVWQRNGLLPVAAIEQMVPDRSG